MSEATAEGELDALRDATLVDTDVHLRGIDNETLAASMEPYYARRLKGNQTSRYLIPKSGWDRSMGDKIEHRSPDPEEYHRTLVEEYHVDRAVLNPTSLLPRLPDPDLARNYMKGYNDVLLEDYVDQYDEFSGLLALATQEPEAAAEEIDRLGDEEGIVGVYLASTGERTPLGHERFDVVYQAVQDHGLHVAYHGSAGAFMFDFPRQNQAYDRFITVHTLAHAWSQMETLTSLIVKGVPEKFPGINFSFLEAGIGWVPYLAFRLNREYSMRREEAPLLEKQPEEYIRERCYFATQPVGEPMDPDHLTELIGMVGTDSVMFSSDYPHWDFDHPKALDTYVRSIPAEDRERVLAGNAVEAFGLD